MRRHSIVSNPDYGTRPHISPLLTACLEPGCQFYVSDRTQESALRGIEIHPCPYSLATKKVTMPDGAGYVVPAGRSLLEQAWEELDRAYEYMLSCTQPHQADEINATREYMRGMSTILLLWMSPHITSSQDMAREVVKRKKARDAGEVYETPGLGIRRFDPPPGMVRMSARQRGNPVQIQPPAGLTPAQVVQIRQFKDAFTVEQLAQTYSVSVSVIESVIGGLT